MGEAREPLKTALFKGSMQVGQGWPILLISGAAPRRDLSPGAGFTLLELVTVIAILGLLLGIALPSYQHYMLRVNRTEAISALLEIAGCQERLFAQKGRFDTTRCLPKELDHYAIRMEPQDEAAALAFTAWAEPLGSQARDPCGQLGLDQTGLRQATGDGADAGNCWRAKRF